MENGCAVCGTPCERKCSTCKLVFYCSIEHQKSDWKAHRAVCKAFKVCESKELGRFLCAARDLSVGDVIVCERPFVVGPKPQRVESEPFPCVGCCRLIDAKNVKQCPECNWPACGEDCEGLKTSSLHGFECCILKMKPRIERKSFFDYFRFDILIIFRTLYLKKFKPEKFEEVMALEAHLESRNPETEIYQTIQEKANHIRENYLKPMEEAGETFFSDITDEIIHKIYGIFDVNATELSEEKDVIILYPTGSLMEHNCTPNTRQIINPDNKYQITVKAALPIEADANITSIYTHILWGTHARQQHLQQNKYFTCTCARCVDPTEFNTFLSALKCLGTEKEPCGGTQLPSKPLDSLKTSWVCDKCAIELPGDEIVKFVNHLSDEVDKVLACKPVLEQLEDFLGKILNFLHPSHYLAYSIRHSLVQLCGRGNVEASNAVLEEKVKTCEELIKVTKKIDPGNARLSLYLGVLLNELFFSKFKLLNRKSDGGNKSELVTEIDEISVIIEESKRVLEEEMQNAAGTKLYNVVEENERKFGSWLEETT